MIILNYKLFSCAQCLMNKKHQECTHISHKDLLWSIDSVTCVAARNPGDPLQKISGRYRMVIPSVPRVTKIVKPEMLADKELFFHKHLNVDVKSFAGIYVYVLAKDTPVKLYAGRKNISKVPPQGELAIADDFFTSEKEIDPKDEPFVIRPVQLPKPVLPGFSSIEKPTLPGPSPLKKTVLPGFSSIQNSPTDFALPKVHPIYPVEDPMQLGGPLPKIPKLTENNQSFSANKQTTLRKQTNSLKSPNVAETHKIEESDQKTRASSDEIDAILNETAMILQTMAHRKRNKFSNI